MVLARLARILEIAIHILDGIELYTGITTVVPDDVLQLTGHTLNVVGVKPVDVSSLGSGADSQQQVDIGVANLEVLGQLFALLHVE